MKKLAIIIGLLLIVVGIVLPLVVDAVIYESDDWYADASVSYNLPLLDENGSFQKNVRIVRIVHKSDGEVAFCVEAEKETLFNKNYSQVKLDSIFDSIEQRIEVAKIVMAYKAVETNYASKWTTTPTYAAAQYLIWDILGYEFDLKSSSSDYAKFSSEIAKIQKAKNSFEQELLSPDLSIDDAVYLKGDRVYVTDSNGILNSNDYEVKASEGIDELVIEDNGLSFVISDDSTKTKYIEVEYVGDVPASWEYGELWSTGTSQKIFTFFSVDLPALYSGASVSLLVEESGTLTIIKRNESGEVITDADFTFAIYEAIWDGYEYSIGEVLEGYDEIVVRGIKSVNITPGHYFIKEVKADDAYLKDEEAYLIEVIVDSETEFTLVNQYKKFTISVNKYDENDDSPISGADFVVYSLEDAEDSVYLLKTGETIDLSNLLGNDNIYIAEEDIDFDGKWFMSDDNRHVIAYAISKVDDDFTLEGFEALVYRSDSYIDPLEDVKVYKGDADLSASLECIYDGSERIVYKFSDEKAQYLIIRPKKTYDISEPDVEGEAMIYMIKASFNIYTGSSDIYNGNAYSIKEVAASTTSATGEAIFYDLKETADYLLCEVSPPEDYEYGSQDPCITITGDKSTFTNVTFTNKMRSVSIEVFKTDSNREILLNGAEFIAYKVKKTSDGDFDLTDVPEDAVYLGNFISGYMHVTLADFGLADDTTDYTLAIYSEEELIKEVSMQQELNVDGLDDGIYDLYLCDKDGSVISTVVQKEVAKGKIIFDDIRYDEALILFETKAPSGYKLDIEGFVVETEGAVINGRIAYNRVNEALILPFIIVNTSCHGS